MLSSQLETDIRAVKEHLFGTGTYVMFQRIEKELEELAQQTHNTGSPKILDQILCAYSGKVISNKKRHQIIDAFVEKLRAGA